MCPRSGVGGARIPQGPACDLTRALPARGCRGRSLCGPPGSPGLPCYGYGSGFKLGLHRSPTFAATLACSPV